MFKFVPENHYGLFYVLFQALMRFI